MFNPLTKNNDCGIFRQKEEIKKMLTIQEAADLIAEKIGRKSFPTATIRSWIFQKKLVVHRVGGRNYVKPEDLEFFLPKSSCGNNRCFSRSSRAKT